VSRDPFAWIAAGATRSVARIAGGVTLTLILAIQLLGPPLRTDAAPFGIVSLQLATSEAQATAIVASWTGTSLGVAALTHGLDLLLPFAYALAIGAAARSRALVSASALAPARLAGWAAVLAAATDQIENAAMAATILGRISTGGVLVTLGAAAVKWATLALAVGALALAARRARRDGAAADRGRA
jgi:hypothetical protein